MHQVKVWFIIFLFIGCANPQPNTTEKAIGPFGPQWICRTSKESGFILRMETDGRKALVHGVLVIGKERTDLDPNSALQVFSLDAGYTPETTDLNQLNTYEFLSVEQSAAIKLEQVPANKGDLLTGVGRGSWKMSFRSAEQANTTADHSKFSNFAFKIFSLFKIGNHEGFYGSPNRDFYLICEKFQS